MKKPHHLNLELCGREFNRSLLQIDSFILQDKNLILSVYLIDASIMSVVCQYHLIFCSNPSQTSPALQVHVSVDILCVVQYFIIRLCDPKVVICYLIWPCDIAVHITYLISHSSSLGCHTIIKGKHWSY